MKKLSLYVSILKKTKLVKQRRFLALAKDKNVKTNAMRILDRAKVKYKVNYYECDEFIDGIHIADKLSQPYEISFKTLVTKGKSGEH